MRGDIKVIEGTTYIEDQHGYLMTWAGIDNEVDPDGSDKGPAEADDERKEGK